jgi:DICT domain-containing protein/GAF domain-containing protein
MAMAAKHERSQFLSMGTAVSNLDVLLQQLRTQSDAAFALHPQIYFKASLTALSHAMEDQVLAGADQPLVIASFQQERFYRQEARRYKRIAEQTDQVYVLAAPDTDFVSQSKEYEMIAFTPDDALRQEWNLVVVGPSYTSCLICRERDAEMEAPMDQTRRFEGIWTFDRQVSCLAAHLLLDRILHYRPELKVKVADAEALVDQVRGHGTLKVSPAPFADRLVTYLQAGQYKLTKAYRAIAAKERRERLTISIATTIRQSLDPNEVFQVAVQELGETLAVCRCLIYACDAQTSQAVINHQYLGSAVQSLQGQTWQLQDNPLFQTLCQTLAPLHIPLTQIDEQIQASRFLSELVSCWKIGQWLMVPVLHKGELVGVVELHSCQTTEAAWAAEDLALVEAIAAQVGVAFIQARAYENLEKLNQQLADLEQTRDNLTAIVGHELRTPLSTIQVCLESLATEPDMPPEIGQVMIHTALDDTGRLRELVQDFLMLSRLESGKVQWHLEVLSLQECVDMALSSIRARQSREANTLPSLEVDLTAELPLVRVDGEQLVEVLSKLLDNACKFTPPEGHVSILATPRSPELLQVTIADTGRGIDPERLEAVFERFYQEEGALRRTTGGTGLGLAICRQIIGRLGGEIWAESQGRDRGAKFHFTVPIAQEGFDASSAESLRDMAVARRSRRR